MAAKPRERQISVDFDAIVKLQRKYFMADRTRSLEFRLNILGIPAMIVNARHMKAHCKR